MQLTQEQTIIAFAILFILGLCFHNAALRAKLRQLEPKSWQPKSPILRRRGWFK